MKYKINFYYNNGMTETYSGGTFVFQGERYAIFDCMNPKLYNSKKIAENSAKKLIISCVNTSPNYEVVEDDEQTFFNADGFRKNTSEEDEKYIVLQRIEIAKENAQGRCEPEKNGGKDYEI